MKKAISKKWIIVCLCMILAFIVLFVVMRIIANAENKDENLPLINREGPALKVGRYYIDGDTEQYYLEVTEEGTIQLCDIDYLEYAWIGNSTDGLSKAEADKVTENVKKQADEYSKKYEYKVYKTGVGTMIFTEWEEVDGQCFGSGYTLLDENTIRGGNSIFIYYDEELGDTVYKTETPTRVVYSVSYKEKTNSDYKKVSSDVGRYVINVCCPKAWNEYCVTIDMQYMGIQLFNGEIPKQLEVLDGDIYIACATSGFADTYAYSSGYTNYDAESFTTENGYKLKIYYNESKLPVFATFDDYSDMCIFFSVETTEEIPEILNIINSIELT